jgi:predicted nucleic acid-binding protein
VSDVLADTSIWVAYLRHGPGHPHGRRIDAALEAGGLHTCGPVVAELLAGARAADRGPLGTALQALDWVGLGRDEWIAVGELAGGLREAGRSLPLTDVEIAVAAITADATLLTADADFERIAELDPRLDVDLVDPAP